LLVNPNLFSAYTSDLVVQFDPATYTVDEGNQASLKVVLNIAADRDVTVDFSTVDASAKGMTRRQHAMHH